MSAPLYKNPGSEIFTSAALPFFPSAENLKKAKITVAFFRNSSYKQVKQSYSKKRNGECKAMEKAMKELSNEQLEKVRGGYTLDDEAYCDSFEIADKYKGRCFNTMCRHCMFYSASHLGKSCSKGKTPTHPSIF